MSKAINTIRDLRGVPRSNAKITCVMPDGSKKNLSESFYVEDGTFFLHIGNEDEEPETLNELFNTIDCERSNKIWHGDGSEYLFDDRNNSFYFCNIRISGEDCNYIIADSEYNGDEFLFVLEPDRNLDRSIPFNGYFSVEVLTLLADEIDIKERIVDNLNGGFGAHDEIYEELESTYGEEAMDGISPIDFNDYVLVDENSVYIDGDRGEIFNNACAGIVSFAANCWFDVEKFEKDYNLEEVKERDDR